MKKLYAVEIGTSRVLVEDRWIFEANNLEQAIAKAQEKRRRLGDTDGWVLLSAKEIGKLSK